MPKIRTETLDQHHETTWSVLTDALERLLAERPYDEISLADIAIAAGIGRSTIYNYAKDKSALIARTTAISGQELLDQVVALADEDGSPRSRLAATLQAILAWFGSARHRHLLLHVLFGSAPLSLAELASAPLMQINVPVQKLLQEGIESGDFRPVGDVGLIVELMAGVVHRAAVRVARAPDALDGIVSEVVAFVFGGLGCEVPKVNLD